MKGCWVMVCGPSGAGKDSVLAWAQAALAGHPRVRFARRMVTREAHVASDHDVVSPQSLDALQAGGGLAWHWQAHGFRYAVASGYADEVAQGRLVVVNGSREHVQALAARHDVRCVLVTAPAAVLAQRLHARARENAAAVAQRVARNGRMAAPPADLTILNEGDLAAAGASLRDYLLELMPCN
jgi:ribose 1,5-bisphosphokinase